MFRRYRVADLSPGVAAELWLIRAPVAVIGALILYFALVLNYQLTDRGKFQCIGTY